MNKATALQNETIDALVYRVLKRGSPIVEQVMELNPNLAGILVLEIGTEVILPSADKISKPLKPIINLWD